MCVVASKRKIVVRILNISKLFYLARCHLYIIFVGEYT